jgi:phosphohistidine phosphatase
MKKLIFVRHGKAEEPSSEVSDFERSLTPRGKAISRQMALKLRDHEKSVGLIVTSPAFRALETALIFADEFRIEHEKILLKSNLYYKMDLHYLTDLLSQTGDEINIIALFGHNPSFTHIAGNLSREGCDFMPKSGVAVISFKIESWADLKKESGIMEYFLKPDKIL